MKTEFLYRVSMQMTKEMTENTTERILRDDSSCSGPNAIVGLTHDSSPVRTANGIQKGRVSFQPEMPASQHSQTTEKQSREKSESAITEAAASYPERDRPANIEFSGEMK